MAKYFAAMSCGVVAQSSGLEVSNLQAEWKVELVETVKDSVPECRFYWDQTTEGTGYKPILLGDYS